MIVPLAYYKQSLLRLELNTPILVVQVTKGMVKLKHLKLPVSSLAKTRDCEAAA